MPEIPRASVPEALARPCAPEPDPSSKAEAAPLHDAPEPGETLPGIEGGGLASGIVEALGELGPGAWITEAGLARLLGKCTASIKAAVERGELPRPAKLMGKNTWTAGALVRHLEARLEHEARKFARLRA